jgi:hypothetical protein
MESQRELLTYEVLRGLTDCVAGIGVALSVHLPAADLDDVLDSLTVVQSKLNVLGRL